MSHACAIQKSLQNASVLRGDGRREVTFPYGCRTGGGVGISVVVRWNRGTQNFSLGEGEVEAQ